MTLTMGPSNLQTCGSKKKVIGKNLTLGSFPVEFLPKFLTVIEI
jgi:hypothetical protein